MHPQGALLVLPTFGIVSLAVTTSWPGKNWGMKPRNMTGWRGCSHSMQPHTHAFAQHRRIKEAMNDKPCQLGGMKACFFCRTWWGRRRLGCFLVRVRNSNIWTYPVPEQATTSFGWGYSTSKTQHLTCSSATSQAALQDIKIYSALWEPLLAFHHKQPWASFSALSQPAQHHV